ncbi:MAG: sialidase family protein, partial [Bacteroidales bacterium]
RALETRRSVDTRRVFSLFSDDNGLTWSKPRDITSEVKRPDWTWFATGPCHAIVKRRSPHKGRLIVPSNHKEISDEGEVWSFSQIIYSDDEGEHWHIGAVSQVGGNESSVAELRNGDLCLNMRHTEKKDSLRLYALSRDGGESFYERGQCPDLVEPRCQGSLLNYSFSSRLSRKLLFSGVLSSKSRENLSLSVSTDGGRTWAKTATLFKGASAYSDIVLLDSRRLGVLFENGAKGDLYRRISFSLLDL